MSKSKFQINVKAQNLNIFGMSFWIYLKFELCHLAFTVK
jgi:hypothetical protein